MWGLIIPSSVSCSMLHRGMIPWKTLNRWRGRTFLAAGGLFLISPLAKGLILITGEPLPELVIALLAFSGLLAALGGLFGLYPDLSEKVPRHAFAGVLATVIAAGVTIGVFVWLIVHQLLTATSYFVTPGAPPRLAFVSLVVAMALAFTVVGTASVRVAVPSRTVGGLLVALAIPWVVVLSAGAVYGPELPAWISLSSYGAIPVGLLATGFVIRRNDSTTEHEIPSPDATAD